MKRKLLIIILILVVFVVGIFIWHRQTQSPASPPTPTDSEIREKFACDRLTKEYRDTDYYCSHPDAYREGKPIPPLSPMN